MYETNFQSWAIFQRLSFLVNPHSRDNKPTKLNSENRRFTILKEEKEVFLKSK